MLADTDPACGSGAFRIEAFDQLEPAQALAREATDLEHAVSDLMNAASGLTPDVRPFQRRIGWVHDPFSARSVFMSAFDRITCDSGVMGGKACVRGLRIGVGLIVNLVASGMTPAEILGEYPSLEPEDITQSLQYAAWLAEETVLPSEAASA